MGAHHVLSPELQTAVTIRELTAGVAPTSRSTFPVLTTRSARLSGRWVPIPQWWPRVSIRVLPRCCIRGGVPSQQGSARCFPDWFGTAVVTSPVDRELIDRTVADLLANGKLDVLPLISHRFLLAQAAKAYELIDQHPEQALQVILESVMVPPVLPGAASARDHSRGEV